MKAFSQARAFVRNIFTRRQTKPEADTRTEHAPEAQKAITVSNASADKQSESMMARLAGRYNRWRHKGVNPGSFGTPGGTKSTKHPDHGIGCVTRATGYERAVARDLRYAMRFRIRDV